MFRITFLGTGGGRHTTISQVRCTGGMLIDHDGGRIHMDPGPGAMTQMHRIHADPGDTDCVIVSHCHPDHYSDSPSAIEGMTHGGWVRRGEVYGSPTVMEGRDGLGPCMSPYHLRVAEKHGLLIPGETLDIGGLKVEIKMADHSDPTNVGFVFDTPDGKVAYVSDTAYSDEIADQYIGCRAVILPITTPYGERIKFHMCTDDAMMFLERVRPEVAVFIHLGIVIIMNGPENEAMMTQERTGVKTVAGRDLMVMDVGKEITFSDAQTFDDDWFPDWFPKSNHPKKRSLIQGLVEPGIAVRHRRHGLLIRGADPLRSAAYIPHRMADALLELEAVHRVERGVAELQIAADYRFYCRSETEVALHEPDSLQLLVRDLLEHIQMDAGEGMAGLARDGGLVPQLQVQGADQRRVVVAVPDHVVERLHGCAPVLLGAPYIVVELPGMAGDRGRVHDVQLDECSDEIGETLAVRHGTAYAGVFR